jgi:hypothetical protein
MRNHCAVALLAVLAGCDSTQPPPQQHAPFLVDSTPGAGAILSPTTDEREISAVVGDENLDDNLSIRFLVDYPEAGPAVGRLIRQVTIPPTGLVDRAPVRLRPGCDTLQLAPGLHRLTMSVSDRPFLDPFQGDDVDPAAPLDSVPGDAFRLRAVWLLNCP